MTTVAGSQATTVDDAVEGAWAGDGVVVGSQATTTDQALRNRWNGDGAVAGTQAVTIDDGMRGGAVGDVLVTGTVAATIDSGVDGQVVSLDRNITFTVDFAAHWAVGAPRQADGQMTVDLVRRITAGQLPRTRWSIGRMRRAWDAPLVAVHTAP